MDGTEVRAAPRHRALISTAVGSGRQGFDGDGGPAAASSLNCPFSVAFDGSGALYIADYQNHRVRKVSPGGTITTVAGNGTKGYGGDGGPATAASLQDPAGVAVDRQGNLYIADRSNQRVRKVDPDGTITTVAGTGTHGFGGDGGPATRARLNFPHSIAVDAAGNLLIADDYNHRLRKVGPDGTITTVAGDGTEGYGGDGGPATRAGLNFPHGLAIDDAGTVYIADRYNYRVRKVTPDGIITTVAGTGTKGFDGDDGPAVHAALNLPQSVALDRTGTLYLADYGNKRVRRLTPDGLITTVAGDGTEGSRGDCGPATAAQLNQPLGIAVDAHGDVYLADYGNHRIRRIRFSNK